MDSQPVASTSALPAEERQIAIRLSTKDAAYSVPPTKFLVPASWRRFHLSELINKVLENSSPIPFDFLVNSSLLRSSLGGYCEQTGTSEEVVLEIEYLPSTLPPQLESTLPSEDWVSDVSVQVKGAILTSSYAGTLSLHSSHLATDLTFAGHDLSALSACYVPHPLGSTTHGWIASGGMDRVGRVWQYDLPTAESALLNPDVPAPLPSTLYTLNLHTAPIASVRSRALPLSGATATASPHLLTAGWDGVVGVWDLTPGVNEGEPTEEGAPKRKRRKQAPGTVIAKSPVSVLLGHTGKVSRAIFDRTDAAVAYSAGWDHTVRQWDLSVAAEATAKTSDKVLLALTQMASPNLLATGSTDRLVSFWDLREATQAISLQIPGHTAPVSSVCAHPTAPLLLASGSYDSTVRIWDARSPKQALLVVPLPPKEGAEGGAAGGEKVLCVDWDGERLVAGGEGARVVSWRVSAQGGKVEVEGAKE